MNTSIICKEISKVPVERAEMELYHPAILTVTILLKTQKQYDCDAEKVSKGLHPDCYIELTIDDSYYNMRDHVVKQSACD